ncbi:hypothetical protein BH23BAC1_BH23BAC1_07510 [soil metagenome]
MHTIFLYEYSLWDIMGMMLIGMACFKWGVFQAKLSNKSYGLMVLIGYAVGISVNSYEINLIKSVDYAMLAFLQAEQTYHLGRVFMIMGHIGLAMVFIKSGILSVLQKALAAVGRMALTNYISHSIFALLIFSGVGLGLFGQLERHQLYFVVFSIWVFQLVVSPIWLKYFYFGPLEWAWRSLTYKKLQKFRKTDKDDNREIQLDVVLEYKPLAPV